MNKTIVIAGFACLSMIAVAQTKTEPAAAPAKRGVSSPMGTDRTTSPRDLASGQASGKIAVSHEIKSPRDSASGQASGRVAAGDVTGDGAATATVKPVSTTKGGVMASDDWESPKAKTAAPGTKAPTATPTPQEQRMHKPMVITK
jgi:hypothetical protein